MKMKLSKQDCKYGAPLGRPSLLPIDNNIPIKYQMVKLNWVDGDYTPDSTYWGGGDDNIYWAQSEIEMATKFTNDYSTGRLEKSQVFVRAKSRSEAKEKVSELVPGAKFYR